MAASSRKGFNYIRCKKVTNDIKMPLLDRQRDFSSTLFPDTNPNQWFVMQTSISSSSVGSRGGQGGGGVHEFKNSKYFYRKSQKSKKYLQK